MVFRIKRAAAASALIFICGLFSFAPAASALQSLQAGMEAPDFTARTPAGEPKTFATVRGAKLTVLVFWSTWSVKSEKILKRMEQLHEKYKGQGLSIVAINADEQVISNQTMADIQAMVAKLKIGFPVLIDQGLVAFHDYGVIALPTTVVLDGDRVIKEELAGYPLVGSEAMVDFIVSSIEGKKKAAADEKPRYQPDKNAVRFYNMGMATLKEDRRAGLAEMWFKKAIQADASFVLPHLTLGRMYVQRGDTALAQAQFREALAKAPGNPEALCELGIILVNDGKGQEGTALFEQARKAEESYVPCYYYSGYALAKEGRLEEAAKMFDEARKLNPFDYNNFIYQAKAFEERKDSKNAVEAYKRALRIILHFN